MRYITWKNINLMARSLNWSIKDSEKIKIYKRNNVLLKIIKIYPGYKIIIVKDNVIVNSEVINTENLTKVMLWEYLSVLKI